MSPRREKNTARSPYLGFGWVGWIALAIVAIEVLALVRGFDPTLPILSLANAWFGPDSLLPTAIVLMAYRVIASWQHTLLLTTLLTVLPLAWAPGIKERSFDCALILGVGALVDGSNWVLISLAQFRIIQIHSIALPFSSGPFIVYIELICINVVLYVVFLMLLWRATKSLVVVLCAFGMLSALLLLSIWPNWRFAAMQVIPGKVYGVALLWNAIWFTLLLTYCIWNAKSRQTPHTCPTCTYDTRGLRSTTCPECGTDIAAQQAKPQTARAVV